MIGKITIKPECRETHGYLEAFDLAMEELRKTYKMFATQVNHDKTFSVINFVLFQ